MRFFFSFIFHFSLSLERERERERERRVVVRKAIFVNRLLNFDLCPARFFHRNPHPTEIIVSTGLVCEAGAANDVHKYIRTILAKMYDDEVAQNTRIQYGGSVTPDSVDGLMAMSDIDGCLVGGASLLADKFARIVNFKSGVLVAA